MQHTVVPVYRQACVFVLSIKIIILFFFLVTLFIVLVYHLVSYKACNFFTPRFILFFSKKLRLSRSQSLIEVGSLLADRLIHSIFLILSIAFAEGTFELLAFSATLGICFGLGQGCHDEIDESKKQSPHFYWGFLDSLNDRWNISLLAWVFSWSLITPSSKFFWVKVTFNIVSCLTFELTYWFHYSL